MDDALQAAASVFKGHYRKNLLLVGKSGVGKSALVAELARISSGKGLKLNIWSTTASAMFKELVEDSGWKANFHRFCEELEKGGEVLHVANLLELFEVGQYMGSNTSLADGLYDFLDRGRISVITEATEDELALIEVRNPRFTQVFHVVRLEEPKEKTAVIVERKVAEMALEKEVLVDRHATEEVLRLQRRYLPYSGFPGKAIRFLENQLMDVPTGSQLDRGTVLRGFSEETGMPLFMIDPDTRFDVEETRQFFLDRVFGQPGAVNAIVDILALVKTGMVRTGKPIASLFFVGPTGVGKTEMAKVLAELMFGDARKLLRFDMSEYSDPLAVMRFTTGFGTLSGEGQLAATVRQNPFCVLLFDEIEKAHPLFFDHLLQILDEGRLTDNRGQLVNFCSTIIVMTSNIGATQLDRNAIGLGSATNKTSHAELFEKAVQKHFKPELFNRIERLVPFSPLDEHTIRHVLAREINLLRTREGIRDRDLRLEIAEPALAHLAEIGYHPRYGAREMQRAVHDHLIGPLARRLNEFPSDEPLSAAFSWNTAGRIELTVKSVGDGQVSKLAEMYKLVNLANRAGQLLNGLRQTFDGHLYLTCQSHLQMLRHRNAPFGHYERVIERFAQLESESGLMEEEISLYLMGFGDADDSWENRLKDTEEGVRSAKLDLLQLLVKERSECVIDIVGASPEHQTALYRDLIERLGNVSVRLESVWFSSSLQKILTTEKGGAVQWLTVGENWESPNWKAPLEDPTSQLVGARLIMSGLARPYLFFSRENGLHKWSFEDGPPSSCHVTVTDTYAYGPEFPSGAQNLNQYFKQGLAMRRTYTPLQVNDSVFGIKNSPSVVKNLVPTLFGFLEKAYLQAIEEELI